MFHFFSTNERNDCVVAAITVEEGDFASARPANSNYTTLLIYSVGVCATSEELNDKFGLFFVITGIPFVLLCKRFRSFAGRAQQRSTPPAKQTRRTISVLEDLGTPMSLHLVR